MKAPSFWQSRGVISTLLLPVSALYWLAGWWRQKAVTPYRAAKPVICVGNVVAGGAGKTPVALAIAEMLKSTSQKPHFLSRGYGGVPQAKPLLVQPQHHAFEVGDEPVLLARSAPCWVSVHRVAAAKAAIAAGATQLILDDGLQNPALHKQVSLLVVDGETGFGNGHIIPAGPLREPISSALRKSDAMIVVGENKHNIRAEIPCFTGKIKPLGMEKMEQPVVAFAGIGRPEKFFAMLREMGVELAETLAFPDHHVYSAMDIKKLRAYGLPLYTTAKDAVKLPAEFLREVTIVEVKFQFDQQQEFAAWLQNKLA